MIPQLQDNVEINQTLPVHPNAALGIGPTEMQQLMDKGSKIIKQYINEDLIPAIEQISAADVSATELTAESGNTVASQLAYILQQVQYATTGEIAAGSITAEKLNSSVRSLLERDLNLTIYKNPGSFTYTVPRTGKYIVTLVGGGGAREGFKKHRDSEYYAGVVSPPTAGGVAVKLLSLTQGTQYTLTVGAGGVGQSAPENSGTSGATSGGTTSFGSTFSATGGNRSSSLQAQMCTGEVENNTVGTGVGGDINISSNPSKTYGVKINDYTGIASSVDIQTRSRNIFSSGDADSLTDASGLFPGGAPKGLFTTRNVGYDGANGGNGAIFILYLGSV